MIILIISILVYERLSLVVKMLKNTKLRKEYYATKELKSLGHYSGKKRHGKIWYYYKSVNLHSCGKYKNGKKDGQWKNYYDDGENIRLIKYFKEGIECGMSEFYNRYGRIESVKWH